MKKQVICPTCGQRVEWSERNPWRPFCSERCRLIDLGAWVEGEHRIAGEEPATAADHPAAPEKHLTQRR